MRFLDCLSSFSLHLQTLFLSLVGLLIVVTASDLRGIAHGLLVQAAASALCQLIDIKEAVSKR